MPRSTSDICKLPSQIQSSLCHNDQIPINIDNAKYAYIIFNMMLSPDGTKQHEGESPKKSDTLPKKTGKSPKSVNFS